ncbi:MAG TPA: DNA repair protein RecN [Candidatus Marinimicrobia bacterium]|nr:DNA repair protein RecN [Candidatus Neomarinimicrobiota bacterium]
MISNISIKNFAIFDDIELDFKKGLTVITGETGSGKSILLSAIRSALGGSVKGTDVRSGEEKAIVEIGAIQNGRNITCRKIINVSGRSRSFLEDEPMNMDEYKVKLNTIADFHGQHEQQYIMKKETHIDFLDTYAKLKNKVALLETIFNDLIKSKQKLKKILSNRLQAADRKELISFQLREIDFISPETDEDNRLHNEYKKLKHADKLISTANKMNNRLTEQDQSLYNELSDISKELAALVSIDGKLQSYAAAIEESMTALMDASHGLRQYASGIDHDEKRLEKVEARLLEVEGLKRKYGGTLEAVMIYRQSIESEINTFQNMGKEISELEDQIKHLRSEYLSIANHLHEERIKAIPDLSNKIKNELAVLNIPKATFEVNVKIDLDENSDISLKDQSVKYSPKGFDNIEFYLSANPGEAVKPLTDVASGGEVSRIMLAIKTIFQEVDPVETLVFDEIDAGISGVTAEKVAESLAGLAKEKQIFCVTHLPQIAAKAQHHLHISKKQKEGRTMVQMTYLNDEEKIHAIAQLFSGTTLTTDSLHSAKSILRGARG